MGHLNGCTPDWSLKCITMISLASVFHYPRLPIEYFLKSFQSTLRNAQCLISAGLHLLKDAWEQFWLVVHSALGSTFCTKAGFWISVYLASHPRAMLLLQAYSGKAEGANVNLS